MSYPNVVRFPKKHLSDLEKIDVESYEIALRLERLTEGVREEIYKVFSQPADEWDSRAQHWHHFFSDRIEEIAHEIMRVYGVGYASAMHAIYIELFLGAKANAIRAKREHGAPQDQH